MHFVPWLITCVTSSMTLFYISLTSSSFQYCPDSCTNCLRSFWKEMKELKWNLKVIIVTDYSPLTAVWKLSFFALVLTSLWPERTLWSKSLKGCPDLAPSLSLTLSHFLGSSEAILASGPLLIPFFTQPTMSSPGSARLLRLGPQPQVVSYLLTPPPSFLESSVPMPPFYFLIQN